MDIPAKEKFRRCKMDFLSSSEDEESVGSENDLVDSSSDDGKISSRIKRVTPKIISDISSVLGKVKIGGEEKAVPRKSSAICKNNPLDDELSSDDDSFLDSYKPAFASTPSKTVASTMSDSKASTTVKTSRSRWRRSVLSKEYTITDTTFSDAPNFRIPSLLYERMYEHQREGVAWMVGLHAEALGGLLADDMGMGKTYQTLAFLGGMMRAKTIKNALILAPLSVLPSWEKEASDILRVCASNACIEVITSECRENRRQSLWRSALECTTNRPHLVITTYGLLSSFADDVSYQKDTWDYIVLDEAQIIKNAKTRVAANVRTIAEAGVTTRRLILSGTPIMNNLSELWALMDFACAGKVLGPESSFKARFQRPIEAARDKDATTFQIEKGKKAAKELQEMLKPHLLQRLKADFLMDKLPSKKDFVVWTHLSQQQRYLYSLYVEAKDGAVMQTIRVKSSPLIALSWLKKLVGHPVLVADDDKQVPISTMHSRDLLRDSVKLQVAVDLVLSFSKDGHKTLLFSQSTKTLDIIQRVLKGRAKGIGRIDGKVTGKNRQQAVDSFNSKGSAMDIMLISTGAGGVGLTLNAADRVILYDPAWNPASDSQAVDRCYRIGQTKDVFVYRLISAGTVEEKIYEKQIHKDGIRRAVTSDVEQAIERHYNEQELRQLFRLGDAGDCQFLDRMSAENGRTGGEDCGIAHPGVIGVSSHTILYDDETVTDTFERNGMKAVDEVQMDNPFSSPTRAASLAIRQTTITENPNDNRQVLGKSQRVLEKTSSTNMTNLQTAAARSRYLRNTTMSSRPDENNNFEFLLKKAERLASSGRHEDAIEVMMDGMENSYNSLDRQQKMRLHSQISNLAQHLCWL